MLLNKGHKPLPFDDYIPDGVIKDLGESYLERLPDVEEHPLTVESFLQPESASWADYAVAYFLLYPYVVLLFALVGTVAFFCWRRFKSRQEVLKMEPCVKCGHFVYLCAPHCQYCRARHVTAGKIGLFGFSSPKRDHRDFRMRLKRFKRCSFCGYYILSSGVRGKCSACDSDVFSSMDEIISYDRYVQKNKVPVYVSVLLISVVPIIGPLISCNLYRRVLIAPYGRYMSFRKNNGLLALLTFARFLFRYVPLIGMVGIPVLSVVENIVFRNLFINKSKSDFAISP